MDIKGMKFQPVGENVLAHVTDEGIMLLAISTKQTLRTSQSGKSDTVATTGGNIPLAGVKVGVNVYRPLDPITIARRTAQASDAARAAQQNGGTAA